MAVTRDVARGVKRHHLALWIRQWQQGPPGVPFRQFLETKLVERSMDPKQSVNLGGQTVDISEILESDLGSYA